METPNPRKHRFMNTTALTTAAAEARGLAMDAVHACNSGHLGLPLGCAEIGAVLFGESMNFNPDAPRWLNRDRFILSAGHGSMFLYGWLHLSGYAVSKDDVASFRKLHSITPGHPEFHETPGVEATTGPLGQGIANAVGFALSGKRAAAKYNTSEHTLFNHHVIALHGDGCLQEGVAKEAIAFAGHSGLDNLVLIYDSNDVTLDAMAEVTQGEDAEAYFKSQCWDAVTIDGHDLAAVAKAVADAKANDNGKPKVIIAKTTIGKGIPEVAGTAKGHGEGGAKFIDSARAGLGLPADEHFFVSEGTKAYFAEQKAAKIEAFAAWQATYDAWAKANPELAKELTEGVAMATPSDLSAQIPTFPEDYKDATRSAGSKVINAVAKAIPQFLTGSADLFGSTKNYLADQGDFSASNPLGRNIWFGIREHAMGAICNGIAYDGLFRASGATFCVFADYVRPAIRLAALSKLQTTFIFTHDSVGVGEDGPTHQPVETVSGLRVIPGVDVIRPGDAEETAGAFIAAMMRTDGPSTLILTRQAIPLMNHLSAQERRDGVLRGAYIAVKETEALTTILIGTGSELQHCVEAAKQLGGGVRVVSMPSVERFERQSSEYKESILPKACTKRVSIEAGVTDIWWKYVGTEGKALGIDRFGISAPGDVVMKELGMTAEDVIAAAK
ncbi:MAG: transketolase [Akkermansiaceae bacterium]|nr:transketolase [Akkermansiaceae bacterium]MDP4647221.1 transketolase [Akkermansiaceae bacterium]MDP4721681.1 transketolase [Akkermansiaceae bacterium]MDP4780901.1 transketolase [Akkermansiaceae bacterium]MDP4846547.1 transketolase [Akkermansiaceae bacterium]